jgi:hypothetical protein
MKLCSVEGCEEQNHGLGLCKKHYQKQYLKQYQRRRRTLDAKSAKRLCSVVGCQKAHYALGRCEVHYQRHYQRLRNRTLPDVDLTPEQWFEFATERRVANVERRSNGSRGPKVGRTEAELRCSQCNEVKPGSEFPPQRLLCHQCFEDWKRQNHLANQKRRNALAKAKYHNARPEIIAMLKARLPLAGRSKDQLRLELSE